MAGMNIWLQVVFVVAAMGLGLPVMASDWPEDVPLPQDALLVPTLDELARNREDISEALVVVQMGLGEENPRWIVAQVPMTVLLEMLQNLPDRPQPEDDVWPKLKPKEPAYKGLTILFKTVLGKQFEPMHIFEGKIYAGDRMIAPDYGRRLEYWTFGTARVRRDQLLGVSVLPVLSFEDCRLLGQRIVETSPRQCLLPNNNLLLETGEPATLESARIENFDQCLQKGKQLIYTFPRRCVAAGGRVFTEPPQVYDNLPAAASPADAPFREAPPEFGSPAALTGGLDRNVGSKGAGTPSGMPSSPLLPGVGRVSSSLLPSSLPLPGVRGRISGSAALPGPMSAAELQKLEPAAGPKPRRVYHEWLNFWK